jgi:hypothetical protein
MLIFGAYLDSPLFTNSEEQESGHPEVVSHVDTVTWTDLELPLGRHDLGVDTRDVDTGVEACSLVVSMGRGECWHGQGEESGKEVKVGWVCKHSRPGRSVDNPPSSARPAAMGPSA